MFFNRPTRHDKLNSVIARYYGTLSDKQMQFLSDYYPRHDGALGDREFAILGELGYTGSLNDRWNAYMQDLGGTGLESLEVLYRTFYGDAGYHENDKDPELVLDFTNSFYRKNGEGTKGALASDTSLSHTLDHTRNGNATMTDSSGNIVWAPHNLLTYSEDLESGGQAYGTGVIASNNFTFTATSDYVRLGESMNVPLKGKYTGKVTVSGGEVGDTFNIELVDNTDGSDSNTTVVTLDGTTKEWVVEADFSGSSTFSGTLGFYINRSTVGRSITAGSTITVNYMHVYRSDLGGMADVPADERVIPTATKYVQTTSAARYLPRRGHHVYNGSQWVNKGLLHESEARTNLITYSEDFSSWSSNNVSVGSGATGPDGVSGSLQKIVEAATTSTHYFTKAPITVPVGTNTFSCFAKDAGDGRWLYLRTNNDGPNQWIVVDLSDGSVTEVGTEVLDYGTIDYGNGIYRAWFSCDSGDGSSGIIVGPSNTATPGATIPNYTGDGTSGVYAGFVQLEAGSTPSSYIPTNGSTVTRAAESITIPAANLPWPNPVYVTGEELVTNGTFDTDVASWAVFGNASSTLTWNAGGYADCNAVTYADGLEQTLTGLTAGGVYEITADITFGTATQCGIWAYTSSNNKTFTSDGSKRLVFTASSTSERISVHSSSSTGTFSVDNISVKEINPLALSIQMSGEMTYADTNQYTELVFWRHSDGASNGLFTYLDTFGTNTGRVYFQSKAASVDDFATVSSIAYSQGINAPFNVSSRHGSTFVNGAVDGVSGTANTTPVALPDLSSTDLDLAYDFMGTISLFRIWANDIGDTGIEEATEPSTEATLFLSFDGTENSYVNFDWSE